jgi:hypothetical protein
MSGFILFLTAHARQGIHAERVVEKHAACASCPSAGKVRTQAYVCRGYEALNHSLFLPPLVLYNVLLLRL